MATHSLWERLNSSNLLKNNLSGFSLDTRHQKIMPTTKRLQKNQSRVRKTTVNLTTKIQHRKYSLATFWEKLTQTIIKKFNLIMKKHLLKTVLLKNHNNTTHGKIGNLMIHGKLIIIIYHKFMVM